MPDVLSSGLATGSGGLVGLVLGLVGGGGSILAVPLLTYVVGVSSPHVALGTSALAVSVSAAGNLIPQARAGHVKWRCAATFSLAGVAGALAGAAAAKAVDGQKLLALFGVVMLVVGGLMLRERRGGGDPDVRLTARTAPWLLPWLLGIGFGVGLFSGFFGIGGGFLIVPGLIWATGMPLTSAIGTSLVAVSAFGAATAASYAVSGQIDWPLAGLFILGGVAGGFAGAHLGKVLADHKRALNLTFAGLVILVGLYIVARGLAPLLGWAWGSSSSEQETLMTNQAATSLRGRPLVAGFYEERTGSVQYVVTDPETKRCAIIDPVLDFDPKSGATATRSADALLAHIEREGYALEWILDTHPHADHFSAAGYLHDKTGVPTAIGEKVVEVQELWKGLYNLPDTFRTDGSQWNRLFADGERFRIGNLDVEVLFTPGHTLASIAYRVGDAAFIHDTLFMPDGGTARADFPGGSARALWASIQRILSLPDETRLFTGHDYPPEAREPAWASTVAQQRTENKHLTKADGEAAFIALREGRDHDLPMPKLILHSLQVNIRGGRLPEPEANGKRYLRIPLDALGEAAWGE